MAENNILKDKLAQEKEADWGIISGVLLYINLFSLAVFILSVISTKARVEAYFAFAGVELPKVSKIMLSFTNTEYMMISALAGVFLIIKERFNGKRLTMLINAMMLLVIWGLQVAYVWGLALGLKLSK